MSDSVRPHRRQCTRLPYPWDSPGKNTVVGCHFLLQRMEVKSESEAAQSCLTLSYPMDCSLPGSSVHGIFQARVLEWGAIAFSGNDDQVNIILTDPLSRNQSLPKDKTKWEKENQQKKCTQDISPSVHRNLLLLYLNTSPF